MLEGAAAGMMVLVQEVEAQQVLILEGAVAGLMVLVTELQFGADAELQEGQSGLDSCLAWRKLVLRVFSEIVGSFESTC